MFGQEKPERLTVQLRRKDLKQLGQFMGQAALMSRPPHNWTVGFLDLCAVQGTTADGGQVSFSLSQMSHLSSHLPNPAAGESAPPAEALPAVIHFVNGDFVVMRDNFAIWNQRIDNIRASFTKELTKGIVK